MIKTVASVYHMEDSLFYFLNTVMVKCYARDGIN